MQRLQRRMQHHLAIHTRRPSIPQVAAALLAVGHASCLPFVVTAVAVSLIDGAPERAWKGTWDESKMSMTAEKGGE